MHESEFLRSQATSKWERETGSIEMNENIERDNGETQQSAKREKIRICRILDVCSADSANWTADWFHLDRVCGAADNNCTAKGSLKPRFSGTATKG